MKIKKSVLLVFSMLSLSLSAADSTNRLHFPMAGFSIAPLDAPPGDLNQSTLMMFLPASGQYSANVNVMIQPFTGDLAEYSKLTLGQFKTAALKVVEQKNAGTSAVIFEYAGVMQGQPLHWYSRAEKSGDHIYLVTATAQESGWAKQSAQLKNCVDSFLFEKR
jgi:hypothetical protein